MINPESVYTLISFRQGRITRQPTILAVDDIPVNRSLLDETLRAAGYQVSVAASGKEALGALSRTVVDGAVLDIGMPEMSGFDLFSRMREDAVFTSLPVIFVTADKDLQTVKKAVEMGAAGYVVKPYHSQTLVQKVHLALKQAEVDQGVLYLMDRMRAIHAALEYTGPEAAEKVQSALKTGMEIPTTTFISSYTVELNRLRLCLTRKDFSHALKLTETIMRELKEPA